jgi:hypothetical protein
MSEKSVSILLNHSKQKSKEKEFISRNELQHISSCLIEQTKEEPEYGYFC